MRNGGTVGNDGHLLAHPLEAVPDLRRHLHQGVVVGAQEQLHEVAPGGGALPVVVQHHLDAPVDTGVVQAHAVVQVPPLHDAGIDRAEVDLAELDEVRIVATQHVEDRAALVRNPTQWNHLHAVDYFLAHLPLFQQTQPAWVEFPMQSSEKVQGFGRKDLRLFVRHRTADFHAAGTCSQASATSLARRASGIAPCWAASA